MSYHAGYAVLMLLQIEPDTLRVGRYQAQPHPDQQDSDRDSKAAMQWSAQAVYQTPGKAFGQERHASNCFCSEQLMASSDGTQVVLITGGAGTNLRCV